MLRSLGITTAVRWFVIACVGLAVWRGFNGDIGAIVDAVWGWIQTGAEVVTNIWHEVNKSQGKGK
jgi:hypothetical protein